MAFTNRYTKAKTSYPRTSALSLTAVALAVSPLPYSGEKRWPGSGRQRRGRRAPLDKSMWVIQCYAVGRPWELAACKTHPRSTFKFITNETSSLGNEWISSDLITQWLMITVRVTVGDWMKCTHARVGWRRLSCRVVTCGYVIWELCL